MALSKVDVANMLTGVTPVANGGTALSSGFNNGLWVKLGETNITSATANVEFTSITSTYKTHVAVISRLEPASGDVKLKCQMRDSSDNGYETSSYAYATRTYNNGSSSSSDQSTNASDINLMGASDGMGDGSHPYGTSCIVYMCDFMDNGHPPSVFGNGTYAKESGFSATCYFGGTYRDTSIQMNGIKFFFNSGDIEQGNFRFYGIGGDA
tara:strand:- start:252 stop:881 length:630 start_codon:yes stop_codon:yes gene_type:complete